MKEKSEEWIDWNALTSRTFKTNSLKNFDDATTTTTTTTKEPRVELWFSS